MRSSPRAAFEPAEPSWHGFTGGHAGGQKAGVLYVSRRGVQAGKGKCLRRLPRAMAMAIASCLPVPGAKHRRPGRSKRQPASCTPGQINCDTSTGYRTSSHLRQWPRHSRTPGPACSVTAPASCRLAEDGTPCSCRLTREAYAPPLCSSSACEPCSSMRPLDTSLHHPGGVTHGGHSSCSGPHAGVAGTTVRSALLSEAGCARSQTPDTMAGEEGQAVTHALCTAQLSAPAREGAQDPVGVLDGGQPVGNHQHGVLLHQLVEGGLQAALDVGLLLCCMPVLHGSCSGRGCATHS